MLVGLITLITIVLLGGSPDYFLIMNLDKGIKKFVDDKQRKKEILAEFKVARKDLNQLIKSRKATVKELKRINADRSATRDDFINYQDTLLNYISSAQEVILDTRVNLVQKISDDEWDLIMDYSIAVFEKDKEKLQLKIDKGKVKDPFDKLEESINKIIEDVHKRSEALNALNSFKTTYAELAASIAGRNVSDTPLLRNKNASKKELLDIAGGVNEIRIKAFQSFVDFHFKLLKCTSEKEWVKLIKHVNNILDIQ